MFFTRNCRIFFNRILFRYEIDAKLEKKFEQNFQNLRKYLSPLNVNILKFSENYSKILNVIYFL